MKFYEVVEGQRFIVSGIEYIKIPEERVNCCKILANAMNINDSVKIVVADYEEVEVVIE